MKAYFDNAATTKISPSVMEAMLPWLSENYGNASAAHSLGRRAAVALGDARRECAAALGCDSGEIIFTSGGTESDNLALRGGARLMSEQGRRHIIVSSIEHDAVLNTVRELEKSGASVTYLPVGENGIVRTDSVRNAFRPDTGLVSVMYVNNETGAVQPVPEIGALCRERNVLFHTDAVQAAGNLPINVRELNADMLSVSGHKLHAMKGTGLLYVRAGVALPPMMTGGGQERGLRSGTENIAGAVGLAKALTHAVENMAAKREKLSAFSKMLTDEILKIDGARLSGDREKRIAAITAFTFDRIEGESLVLLLDLAGVAASSASACASGRDEPSHVLTAMGISVERAAGSLRLSMSEYTTRDEVEYLLSALPKAVGELRALSTGSRR